MPELHTRYKPMSPTCRMLPLSAFKGVDLTAGAAAVDPRRSPDAPNMMPDGDGFPVKRPGYAQREQLGGAIHAAHTLQTPRGSLLLIHAGRGLYYRGRAICTQMADGPSQAVQLNGCLYIADGSCFWRVTADEQNRPECRPAAESAAVPVITLSKGPGRDGGAVSYKPLNLLTGLRTESYLGTAEDTEYLLSFGDLSPRQVTAEVRSGEGGWQPLTEGRDFTVNRPEGVVRFAVPPGAPQPVGEDNVRITYEVECPENRALIDRCTLAVLYGVNGNPDRVFLSGDPQNPGVDRWSEWNDPTYFADLNYSRLGTDRAPVMGYSMLGGLLVAHKQGEENDRNAFVRRGRADEEGNALFEVTNVICGEGPVSSRCFAVADSEPVFLGRGGVYALTAADVTGERYCRKRSYYIDGALRKLDLTQSCACMWGRFYVLAAGGGFYLLDTEQKTRGGSHSSEFVYECYTWPNIAATALWTEGDTLCFGDREGRVFAFWPGDGFGSHYADVIDGAEYPIEAYWSTPLLSLGDLGRLKTIQEVWISAQPYGRSGGTVYYAGDKGPEHAVKSYRHNIFDWNDFDFNDFCFNLSDRPVSIRCGAKEYGVQLFAVKAGNNALRQPFGLYGIQIEYTIGSRTPL